MQERGKPGPKPSITQDVVEQVSGWVAVGIPLKWALAAIGKREVNEDTWKKALKAHPEFSPQYSAAKGKFLVSAVLRLVRHDDAKHLEWVLARRHSDLFGGPADSSISVQATASAEVQFPTEFVKRVKERIKQVHGRKAG